MLHYLRIREWQDLVSQLRRVAKDIGLSVPGGPLPDEVDAPRLHQALLAGLLSHSACATRRGGTTSGRAGRRFVIWPGSAVAKQAAGVGGRRRAGGDLTAVGPGRRAGSSRSGSSRWPTTWCPAATASRTGRPGAARSWPTSGSRSTACRSSPSAGWATAAIDPEVSRELFIRHALVEGEWTAHHALRPGQRRAGSRRSSGSRRAPGGATSWPTRRRGSTSSTQRVPQTLSPNDTSTAGGSRPGASSPSLLDLRRLRAAPLRDDRRSTRGRVPRHLVRRRRGAAADLPVRARRRPPTASPSTCRSRCWVSSTRRRSAGRCRGCARSSSPR